MQNSEYPPPVSKLLTSGDVGDAREWQDYRTLGLGPEHAPDLIRMATDEVLHRMLAERIEVWAPVHAWRALGELRVEAAIGPLLNILFRIDEDEDDFAASDLPEVFGMIGPAALQPLEEYLGDPAHGLYARVACAEGIAQVGQRHPETRTRGVTILSGSLGQHDANDPVFNAFLVIALLDLKAVEVAPVMERAFAAGRVDRLVVGSWDAVQVKLGLKPDVGRALPKSSLPPMSPSPTDDAPAPRPSPGSTRRQQSKAKAKRKMAKASRKMNRRLSRRH